MTSPPGSQNASPAQTTRRLTLELEHLAIQHIAEGRSGVPMRRSCQGRPAGTRRRWSSRAYSPESTLDSATPGFHGTGHPAPPRVRVLLCPGTRRDYRAPSVSLRSSLARAEGEPGNELPLQREEDYQGGNSDDRRA